ncbi:uncharacterized protein BcabD6B2_50850 [Babesia caballi]|uniref:Uncharacterized protein n=1 Tax=Babesia caballi TaxID=5871 RepID=A0AAV4M0C1_BABCB|nr:hypothetical protein BcabD6B2_50850 [Babesia caballi]
MATSEVVIREATEAAHEVAVLAKLRVETVGDVVTLKKALSNHRALETGVLGNLLNRSLDSLADDVHADLLVVVLGGQVAQTLRAVKQRAAAARYDAPLHGGLGRTQRVVDAVASLADLDLTGTTDANDGDAASQTSETLLELVGLAEAQLVHDEDSQRFAVDVLGNDQQRRLLLEHVLEHGQNLLHAGNLFVAEEYVGVLELHFHILDAGHEVRRDVALVPLHPLHHLQLVLEGLALGDGDGALLADLLHGVGDELADDAVAVSGDGCHVQNLVAGSDLLLDRVKVLDHALDSHVDAAQQVHRVQTGVNGAAAALEDRAGQNRGRGGPIAGLVVGVRRHLANELRAQVLEFVRQLDSFGHGDAVLGDLGCSVRLRDDDVAALGAQRHGHCVHQAVHSAEQSLAALCRVLHLFGEKPPLGVEDAASQLALAHNGLRNG